jgi:hypothetical protein
MKSALLAFVKHDGSHTAASTAKFVNDVLDDYMGKGRRRPVAAVTDGAANVLAAGSIVGNSRRCLVHAVNLVAKYVIGGRTDTGNAIAAGNYFGRVSHLSSRFRRDVGPMATGSHVRWGSYLAVAESVTKKAERLHSYWQLHASTSATVAQFRPRYEAIFMDGGLAVCNNLFRLLKPLQSISLLGQKGGITASRAVPAILRAWHSMDKYFNGTDKQHELARMGSGVVEEWRTHFNGVMDHYLGPFLEDELFVGAIMLDPSSDLNEFKDMGERGLRVLSKCTVAVRGLLDSMYKELEEEERKRVDAIAAESAAAAAAASAAAAPAAPGVPPAAAAGGGAATISWAGIAGLAADHGGVAEVASIVNGMAKYRKPDAELNALVAALDAGKGKELATEVGSELAMYNNDELKLWLAREVAVRVLVVPVSEADNERDFGVGTWFHRPGRAQLSLDTLFKLVFHKVNDKLLKELQK